MTTTDAVSKMAILVRRQRIADLFAARGVPVDLHLDGSREGPDARLDRLAASPRPLADIAASIDGIADRHGLDR